ncbi:hypothetical protein H072_10920 [Dactylellina haptotyla CBS 200.50]|uniref:Uncharacterized protein n=1 Tax=Dactylellina haptotyla (strain CBS 200.50) TaxID=1284197 RepID=S7ZYV8_DACHA|nr:hypothetical protein H072_10920 [Dactylellina haptotyla CBS 200.50]
MRIEFEVMDESVDLKEAYRLGKDYTIVDYGWNTTDCRKLGMWVFKTATGRNVNDSIGLVIIIDEQSKQLYMSVQHNTDYIRAAGRLVVDQYISGGINLATWIGGSIGGKIFGEKRY